MALMLSGLIVMMGSGLLMLHCCHSETTRIVTFDGCGDDGCAPMDGCMVAELIALSPTMEARTMSYDFQPTLLPLILCLLTVFCPLSLRREPAETLSPGFRHHPPPRRYLSILRVLRI